MEDLLGIVLIFLLAWLAVPAILWFRQRRLRRQYEADFARLGQRLDDLESALRELKRHPPFTEARSASTVPTMPATAAPPRPVERAEPEHPAPVAPPPGTGMVPPPRPVATHPALNVPAVPPRPVATAPPARLRLKNALALEETLGANWLNKLGVVLLVLGVTFFLIYQFGATPLGKVLLGYLGAAMGLGGGFWLERRLRYKVFARSCIGGGWALAYFTTYALYHVSAAHVLDSETLDLVLLLIIAALMVAHTLHYRSQTACALAFLLGFVTVTISHNTVYSLAAGAVLAVALVAVVWRMRWFELEIFGLLASYLNHFYWLYPIIEANQKPFAAYVPSTALLIFYWAVFRASYLVRRVTDRREENVSTVAGLLNTCLLVALMKYQSQRPELAFWFLLGLGAVELVLGQLPRARRRMAFLLLSTIGVSLLVAAFSFRYTGYGLSVIWLLEAQVLFFAGVLAREIHFRRLGLLAAAVACAQMLMHGIPAGPDLRHGLVFALAALLFYLDAHLVPRLWPELEAAASERVSLQVVSYLGGGMAFLTLWICLPDVWITVGWAAWALALMVLGRHFRIGEFLWQAPLFGIAALLRGSVVNATYTQAWHGMTLRLITLAAIAALLYLCAAWSRRCDSRLAAELRVIYTFAASFLAGLLIWQEVPQMWIPVAWMLLALALALAGRSLELVELPIQANLLAAFALVQVAAVNLAQTELYKHNLVRLETVGAVAALLYVTARWTSSPSVAATRRLPELHTWAASTLLALLAWYELPPISVALAWTALALVLFELGLTWHSLSLRFQGYVGLTAACVRVLFVNLNAASTPGPLSARVYTVLPLAAALYYVYARLEQRADLARERLQRLPQWQAWLGTLTVAAVLRFELPPYWVCAAWAGLALVLVAIAWLAQRRVFEHQAIVLGMAVLVRAVLFNLPERPTLAALQGNLTTLGAATALLLAALPFAFRLRRAPAAPEPAAGLGGLVRVPERHPEQVFFFLAVALITATLAVEMSKGLLTVAWGVEGMLIFLLALAAGERSFRLTGLGMLLVCVLKILCVDVWGLNARDRYLTLIVLGAALLAVSFLYNRYRETVRQFL